MGVCVAKPATRDGQSPTDQRKGAVGSDQLPLGELKLGVRSLLRSISLDRAKAMSYNAASTHARYHDSSGRQLEQDGARNERV